MQGLYRGFLVSVQGIILYRAAYFGLFDTANHLFLSDKNTSMLLKFIVAEVVTTASGLFSYPLDTVRRRMMMQSGLPPSERMYKSTPDCWAKILKHEGAAAFYKGALSNVFRGTGAALVLVFYDKIQSLIY